MRIYELVLVLKSSVKEADQKKPRLTEKKTIREILQEKRQKNTLAQGAIYQPPILEYIPEELLTERKANAEEYSFTDVKAPMIPEAGTIYDPSKKKGAKNEQLVSTTSKSMKERTLFEKKSLNEIFKEATSNLQEILTEEELKIVELFNAGKSKNEIADIIFFSMSTNKKRKTVQKLRSSAKKKVEEQRFSSYGIVSVGSYKDNTITSAAAKGLIEAERFLQYLYSRRSTIDTYNTTQRRQEDTSLRSLGYVLAREETTHAEYQSLYNVKKYKPLLKVDKGRVWISRSDLESFRKREIPNVRVVKPPTPQHRPLTYFCGKDEKLIKRMYAAVSRGVLPVERVGRLLFITFENSEKYLDSINYKRN